MEAKVAVQIEVVGLREAVRLLDGEWKMTKELHDELEHLRKYASQGTVDVVSKAHMCRRIELERLEAVEQTLAQILQVFHGGTSNA